MTIKYIQEIHKANATVRHQGISVTDAFITNISTVTIIPVLGLCVIGLYSTNGDKLDPLVRRLNEVIEPKLSLLTVPWSYDTLTEKMFTSSCTTMSWEQFP